MTLTAPPLPETTAQLWSTMPGWGITANLLPPEVIAGRRLAVIRKVIVFVLAAVVVLAAGGYVYAFFQQRSAHSDLSAEQAKTASLMADQQKYGQVVTLTGTITSIKGQLATLMADDVDTVRLIDAVTARLPHGAQVTQLQLNLDAADQQTATSGSSSGSTATQGGGALDTSGQPHIGSLTVTGTANSMSDIAAFLNQLATLNGVVGVYPTSQGKNASGPGTQFTIQMTLTDELLTHRYDQTAATVPGGK
jgi:Tfp pilus assembly protein PilN